MGSRILIQNSCVEVEIVQLPAERLKNESLAEREAKPLSHQYPI